MSNDDLLPDARTKLFDGEPPEQVFQFLQASGADGQQARDIIKLVQTERNDEIRATGIGKIIYGFLFGVLAVIAWVVVICIPSTWLLYREHGMAFVFAVTLTLFALWRVVLGLKMLFIPRSEKGAVAKLVE